MNTAMTDRVVAITAKPIRRNFCGRPCSDPPRSTWRTIFSPHHDRVVDQIPIASDNAIRVRMLIVKPKA
jgi:hypothetical protein